MPSSLLIESYEFNFAVLISHLDYFTCIKKCRMFPFILNLFNKFYPFPWFFFFFFFNWNEVLEHWPVRREGHWTLAGFYRAVSNLQKDTAAGQLWNIYFSPQATVPMECGELNWKIFISLMISFQHQQLWINFHSLSRRPIHAFPLKIGLKIFYFPCNSQAMCLQIYVHL